MRPRTLDEFIGQEHIIGPGRLLRRAIQADQLSSLIFHGPPGTGKTTLAMVIANTTRSHFITINAVLSGVARIREAIDEALELRTGQGKRTTLFVDEVHRWNKAQQDALLPHVEKGTIILVGATTENPYFEVNKALVSRSRIFQLRPLTAEDLVRVARQALRDPERGYGGREVRVDDEALEHLVNVANGDARSVLNALELAVETTGPGDDGAVHVDLAVAEESIQRRAVLYDKEGDVHYDTISAFIKSLRGSDPDAALYWMARMVYAGEDPRFIFRRMAILASEDVGLADPGAAAVVSSCWDLFEKVGLPEGRFHLAQAALYLATCPKSNSTMAFFDALAAVQREPEPDVPNSLKDPSRDKEGFGHGEGYLYPHAYRDHWVAQQYLPDALQGRVFFQPGDQGHEREIRVEVARRREAQLAAMAEGSALSTAETLTTGPVDRAREAWLQRALASEGHSLGWLRDRLFERAGVQRHHLVLDLHAGSGLLTWEALRRAPEGGVWAQTADAGAARTLRQQVLGLAELDRVAVLEGPALELERLLAEAGAGDVRFDRVLGRDLFSSLPDPGAPLSRRREAWASLARAVQGRLLPAGRVELVQGVPQQTQRIYRLVDWSGVEPELVRRVEQAEESFYSGEDGADGGPRFWPVEDLTAALERGGLSSVEARQQVHKEQRRISEAMLARWFGARAAAAGGGEGTFARSLARAGAGAEDISRVAALYRRQLLPRPVPWCFTVVFLSARKG